MTRRLSDDEHRLREMGHLDADGLPKRAWNNKPAAKKACRAPGMTKVERLVPYRCFVCKLFHIGHR